jgi:hypothetical protein
MLEEEVSEINPHSRQVPQGIKSQLKNLNRHQKTHSPQIDFWYPMPFNGAHS